MRSYAQFNNEKREITFDKYNTPTPWMNELSNGTFHTMMSQAGGGMLPFHNNFVIDCVPGI